MNVKRNWVVMGEDAKGERYVVCRLANMSEEEAHQAMADNDEWTCMVTC